jgi:hypothetical protein
VWIFCCCIAGNTEKVLLDLLLTVKDEFKDFQTSQDAVIQALDSKLSTRLDAVNSSLSNRIQALDTKLSTRIQALDDKLSDRIQALDNKLTALIQQRACDLQNAVANTHNTVNYMQRLMLGPDGQKPGGQGVKGTCGDFVVVLESSGNHRHDRYQDDCVLLVAR